MQVRRTRVQCFVRPSSLARLAAAAALGLGGADADGGVPATWQQAQTGLWTDPARWSTNPNYPRNGTPVGATYDVTVDAAGAPYTVTLNTSVTVDSFRLNSADAVLSHTAGVFRSLAPLDITAGEYRLEGGTLANTTVGGTGGTFTPVSGVLDGVTLARNALIRGNNPQFTSPPALSVRNGLTLAPNATLTIQEHYDGLYGNQTAVFFNGNQTLGGSGVVELVGSFSQPFLRIDGTLTVDTGVTIRGGGMVSAQGLVNKGTITANRPILWFENRGVVVNQGLMTANAGNRLVFETPVDNTAGVIRADGGRVEFGSTSTSSQGVRTAKLGTLEAINGGGILLGGPVDNSNTTFTATPATGNIAFGFVTMTGGRLATTGGAEFYVDGSESWLRNLALAGRVAVRPRTQLSGGALYVQNSVLEPGASFSLHGLDAGFGPNANLSIDGAQTLGGNGEIVFDGAGNLRNSVSAGLLTVGPGSTVRTGTGGGSLSILANDGLVSARTGGRTIEMIGGTNRGRAEAIAGGTLIANGVQNGAGGVLAADGTGSVLTLTGAWSNAGAAVSATNAAVVNLNSAPVGTAGAFDIDGATLNVAAPITTAQIAAGTRSNAVLMVSPTGVITNTGATLLSGVSELRFNGGIVRGGTVAVGQVRVPTGKAGFFEGGVTLAAPVSLDDQTTLRITDALDLDNVDVSLNGGTNGGASIQLFGQSNLGGNGRFLFNGGASSNNINAPGASVDIGPGVGVLTGTAGGTLGQGASSLRNRGTVAATTPGTTLRIIPSGIVNEGLLEATNGASLVFDAVKNSGTVRVAGPSAMTLSGAWTNASGTVRMDGDARLTLGGSFTTADVRNVVRSDIAASTLTMTGSLNNTGQTLDLAPLGPILLGNGAKVVGGTLSTPDAPRIHALRGAAVEFDNVTLDGDVALGAGTGTGTTRLTVRRTLTMPGDRTISGTGDVTLTGPPDVTLRPGPGGTLTIGAGVAVSSAGGTARVGAPAAAVVNEGALTAAVNRKFLVIDGTFTNDGTVTARAGGRVYVPNPGGLTNLSGSTLAGGSWVVQNNSEIWLPSSSITVNDATVRLEGPTSLFASLDSLQLNRGSFTVTSGRDFGSLTAPFTNEGDLFVGGTSIFRADTFSQTAAGELTMELSGENTAITDGEVVAAGQAMLGGTLALDVAFEYGIVGEPTFTLLTAGSIVGQFNAFVPPAAAPGAWYELAYTPTQVLVHYHATGAPASNVPEPGAAAAGAVVAMLGGVRLLSRRRRNRR